MVEFGVVEVRLVMVQERMGLSLAGHFQCYGFSFASVNWVHRPIPMLEGVGAGALG